MTALRFAELMATATGRVVRVLLGIALIALGLFLGDAAGLAIAVVGLVPVAAGVFNVCFVAPLLRVPFRGSKLMAH